MQRGARFAFSGSVPMQRGARFRVLDVPLGGPTWPSEGVTNMYKTNAFLMVLKKQCSTDIENTYFMKMLKTLSPYACAAKSLVGVNTNGKRLITVNRKYLENLWKTNDFHDFQGSLEGDWPDKVRGQTPPGRPL